MTLSERQRPQMNEIPSKKGQLVRPILLSQWWFLELSLQCKWGKLVTYFFSVTDTNDKSRRAILPISLSSISIHSFIAHILIKKNMPNQCHSRLRLFFILHWTSNCA